MNTYEAIAIIGSVVILIILAWGFKPIWDTLKKDLETN